jgi:hypothetical protein
MKNKIAIASAFIAASSFSFAEIALTESFSVEGFIDTSYTDNSGTGNANDASLDVNEVEISFLFDMGGVSARVDTQYTDLGQGQIDQAYVSYDAFGGTLSVGGMDSQLGYEAFEAPGLYTNTTGGSAQLPGTDVAVKFTMDLDAASSLCVALVDEGSFIGDEDVTGTAFEVAYGRDLGNGLGAFVGYRADDAVGGNDVLNAYVTYETGALTFAAEIADGEVTTDYLVLANYAYSDNASVTVRYTTEEVVNGDDVDVLTLAHQIALADNLSLTTELTDNGAATDEYEFSVGALFTF